MPTLHLTGPLGTSISVEVPDERELLGVLRRYGRQGWTSGEIPAGGLSLPLAMADNFDWTLIGARPYTSPDGEQAVIYKGQSYKRRELDEVDTKKIKLPRIVKYSRGARPTDPVHLQPKPLRLHRHRPSGHHLVHHLPFHAQLLFCT